MNAELEKAKKYYEDNLYNEALEILLKLEQDVSENELQGIEIFDEIYKNYKNQGNLKSAFEYYKKLTDEEYKLKVSENKEKTAKLNSALEIHSAQKETGLLQEKNDELNKANEELNELRDKKNELLMIVSEELKLPIVTIEGISLNHFKRIKEERACSLDEIKSDLEAIESLSQEILKNVNSILQKNKEEIQK